MKTLKFHGEDTKISIIFLGENPAFTIKYQNLYYQIYLLKMIRIVVKTLKFLKCSWGEPPLRQNNQSQYNTFHNLIQLKSMKWSISLKAHNHESQYFHKFANVFLINWPMKNISNVPEVCSCRYAQNRS